ncbi:MAG: helix-turn-helix domain-containing protein [Bacteroidales bacterium]|nr:helix-turn-helix domain-containing protein [Bacteroidales bacterium]
MIKNKEVVKFGEVIRQLMRANKQSNRDLAQLLNIAESSLHNSVYLKDDISVKRLMQVGEFLDYSFSEELGQLGQKVYNIRIDQPAAEKLCRLLSDDESVARIRKLLRELGITEVS